MPNNTNCSQTGLKDSIAGWTLYIGVIMTLIGLQIVLLLCVICYYFILDRPQIQRDTPNLKMGWSPFADGVNALYVFIIAWSVGFAWVAFFKRPQSLYSVFLRRCDLKDSSTVAVFIPDSRGVESLNKGSSESWSTTIYKTLNGAFDTVFAFLFSEPEHNEPGQTTYCSVSTDDNNVRFFEFQMRRYNYVPEADTFYPAELPVEGKSAELLKMKSGLTTQEEKQRHGIIGPNVVRIESPSFIKILFNEFSRIFYVYQNFMTWTWLNYSYWHMGIVNTLVYLLGGFTCSIINYRNALRLRELCKVEGTAEVLRDGHFKKVDQAELVPGDVVALNSGIAYCDMVVLTGETVVDESSLTGESMPVVKTALDATDPHEYDPVHHHKHHTIFAGTTIIGQETVEEETSQKSAKVQDTALVVKTGSFTMRGEMIREMYFGKAKQFKFDMEVNIVLIILICYAIFAFSMTIYFLADQPVFAFFFAVYVVASALPPLLPTVFIVSEGISADRLLKKRVAVTDPHRILMAGKVRVAFFDKTGTLTEQGLDFHSVITVGQAEKGKLVAFGEPIEQPSGDISRGMAVCHSLKKMRDAKNGGQSVLLGNAIDRKMFEAVKDYDIISGHGTTPDLIINKNQDDQKKSGLAIMKQFDFDNKRKTQSVIVREEATNRWFIYTKGTSEALKAICLTSSLPANFDSEVEQSAKTGIYAISMGYREVHESETNEILMRSRDEIEKGLQFLGFINFTNPMKVDTPEMVRELKEGDIRTVMISGDHILTAMYIARLSGMVHEESRILLGNHITEGGEISFMDEGTGKAFDMSNADLIDALWKKGDSPTTANIELALLGHVWDQLWEMDKVKATRVAHFVRVIGRCSPHTKITIVDCFNRDGFITLMCGDGGNDCGALKTAHVGVALSDAEASVVAPFTSLDKTILSVVEVLKEGRCTLSSAFSSYKYMIMYGQIETINQMVCAYFSITFSEWCWVFMDGFWVITMAFTLPFADVAPKLAPNRPTSSILGPQTFSSVAGVLIINFLFLILALGVLFQQDFFACRKWSPGSVADVTAIGDNYEASVIWLVSGFQYVTSATAYNFGFQHRAGWWKNWRFVFFVGTWTIIHFCVILYPSTLSCFFRVNCENKNVLRGATSDELVPIQNSWNHTLMPLSFREYILIIVIFNGVATAGWEYFVINGPVAAFLKKQFPKVDRLVGGVGYAGSGAHAGSVKSSKTIPPEATPSFRKAETVDSRVVKPSYQALEIEESDV
jgi:predicted P-type ATPase